MSNIFDRKLSELRSGSSFFNLDKDLLSVGQSGGPQPTANMSRKFKVSDANNTVDVGGIPMKASDDFQGFTPAQTVGIGAAGTGLELAGGLANIRAQEQDELKQLADKFDFDMENIEYQEWMGETVSQIRRGRELEQRINNIRSQRQGGGRQVQQFFRDPVTGAQL